ncbi:MAG TPA: heme-binding domain-containing protein [Panacibacter sp.]|nr:heme-binding domain-containing protein [Panacibacter sp.]
MKKKLLLLLLVVFVAIQFIHPERNESAKPQTADISTIYKVPVDVSNILNKACSDCHSNNTIYPWYANVQPVAWWLNDHIQEGKGEINFNEFASYAPAKQYHKLEEFKKQIDEGEMPLSSYTLIHTNAKLTDSEKKTLTNWSEDIRNQMKAKYPADSLVMKRGPRPPEE